MCCLKCIYTVISSAGFDSAKFLTCKGLYRQMEVTNILRKSEEEDTQNLSLLSFVLSSSVEIILLFFTTCFR